MNPDLISIRRATLASLVSGAARGLTDPEGPEPHGPGTPVIRGGWAALVAELEPNPSPWRVLRDLRIPQRRSWLQRLLGLGRRAADPQRWRMVAFNPQPDPPGRMALAVVLAREAAARVTALHELAALLPDDAQPRVLGAAGAQLQQFAQDAEDGICPPWWPHRWPPRRKLGGDEAINPVELVMMGAELENAAVQAGSEDLRRGLAAAGARLTDVGVSRLEGPAAVAVAA